MTRRTTLSDVAVKAGVSVSTASLAFSGAGPVADGTRVRVLEAAATLGYAGPDPVAASLRRGRSGIVGVVVGERLRDAFRDPFAIGMLDAVAESLAPHGLAMLLLPMSTDAAGEPAEQYLTAPLDVVVFATGGLRDEPALVPLRRRAVPLVAVEGPDVPDAVMVRIEDSDGSTAATRHLLGLGHRRIAVVTMPWRPGGRRGPLDEVRRSTEGYPDAVRRLDGVVAVTRPASVLEAAANDVEEGELAARVLLGRPAHERPTAILAQSDVLAAGVLRAATSLGLGVPDDVSVVGFDGVDIPWLLPHRLTTVVQPVEEKGAAAARAAVELLAGGRPADVDLPVQFRIGTTTGPAPS